MFVCVFTCCSPERFMARQVNQMSGKRKTLFYGEYNWFINWRAGARTHKPTHTRTWICGARKQFVKIVKRLTLVFVCGRSTCMCTFVATKLFGNQFVFIFTVSLYAVCKQWNEQKIGQTHTRVERLALTVCLLWPFEELSFWFVAE